jgi:beta-lactam-binding protein with PASTA domain
LRRVRIALVLAGACLLVATAGAQTSSTVPSVVGKHFPDAVHALVRAGYYADTSPIRKPGASIGTVVAQDPGASSALKSGKAVRIAVAIPKYNERKVKIPKLVGLTGIAARAKLVQLQLMMATKFRKAGRKVGKVIAQNPPAGLTFLAYTQVTILVGK